MFFFLIVIISITVYFDNFYEKQKIDTIIDNVNDFATKYENNMWSRDELYMETDQFVNNNAVSMSIWADFDEVDFGEGGQEVREEISLEQIDEDEEPIEDDGYLFWKDDDVFIGEASSEYNSFGNIDVEEEYNQYWGYDYEFNEKERVEYYSSTIPYTTVKQVDFVRKVVHPTGKKQVIYVNASLHSVDEVMVIINEYYSLFLIIAIILSILMALIYSKLISKPIIKITSVADNMAKMNFDEKLQVTREDELGKLSNSLNVLSTNLEVSLDELLIANQQLKEDYEKELIQEQSRKEFVSNVSHELKTPLGVIKGFAEGVKDDVKEEKKNYYIDVILDEVHKMDRLVSDMLNLSKIEDRYGKSKLTVENVGDLVEGVVSIFSTSLEDRGLSIDISGKFGLATINKERIGLVLNNFINNAIKYCEEKSIIKIHGEIIKGVDEITRITIQNDCVSFSEEALIKVWDRFYKIDISHNREIEGTGLGLAIVKTILEGYGLKYGVYNTDTGVAFYFEV